MKKLLLLILIFTVAYLQPVIGQKKFFVAIHNKDVEKVEELLNIEITPITIARIRKDFR